MFNVLELLLLIIFGSVGSSFLIIWWCFWLGVIVNVIVLLFVFVRDCFNEGCGVCFFCLIYFKVLVLLVIIVCFSFWMLRLKDISKLCMFLWFVVELIGIIIVGMDVFKNLRLSRMCILEIFMFFIVLSSMDICFMKFFCLNWMVILGVKLEIIFIVLFVLIFLGCIVSMVSVFELVNLERIVLLFFLCVLVFLMYIKDIMKSIFNNFEVVNFWFCLFESN